MDPDYVMNGMTQVSHDRHHKQSCLDGRDESIVTWELSPWLTMDSIMVNNQTPRGVTPRGTEQKRAETREVAPQLISLALSLLLVSVTSKFFVKNE